MIVTSGQRFGRLVVIERGKNDTSGKPRWLCRCDCGTCKLIPSINLTQQRTKSCGCLRLELSVSRIKAVDVETHGMSYSHVYRVWTNMKQRCMNPNHTNYENYGARGIKVCERWLVFENFLADMGIPNNNLTLDRIDNNGNYEPGNCRWATKSLQSQNRYR